MGFWQQMKTHNARIWCTTPEYMWTMLKKVVDSEMIFEEASIVNVRRRTVSLWWWHHHVHQSTHHQSTGGEEYLRVGRASPLGSSVGSAAFVVGL